jgi:hypothetical protein
MRRAALLLLLAAPAFAAPAAAAGVPASVKVTECTPALDPEARTATFEARIRALPGADRLAVRFTLQTRGKGELRWRRVSAPGLDSWLVSDHGVGRYAYAKTVRNLTAPASYRVVVRFRWLDAGGDVLRTARQTSAPCRQPDLRPDLVPRRVDVLPGLDPAERNYVVVVRNAGRTSAPASTVTLRIGDRLLGPAAVPPLLADTGSPVAFTAPACVPGEPLELTADAGDAVDEADEDNVLLVPCPAAE